MNVVYRIQYFNQCSTHRYSYVTVKLNSRKLISFLFKIDMSKMNRSGFLKSEKFISANIFTIPMTLRIP